MAEQAGDRDVAPVGRRSRPARAQAEREQRDDEGDAVANADVAERRRVLQRDPRGDEAAPQTMTK